MAFDGKSLDDYIDVAQRISDFRAQYPTGSLQPANLAQPWEQAIVNGVAKNGEPYAVTMIVYTAAAYRTPDDPRPGIGIAWEVFPGRTPYTLGSELMNAETSAWGRAIIAVLASDSKKGVASRQEVRNRAAERDDGLPVNRDGSLSRSQTTDDQKQAAGVMTAAQHAEHTALAKGADGRTPAAERDRARRSTSTPPDDPFYGGGGQALVPDAEDKPGSISRQQSGQIHAVFGRMGITDRGERLGLCMALLDLPELASSSDLSYSQAQCLLAALREMAAG
jgi:hypothetical protein